MDQEYNRCIVPTLEIKGQRNETNKEKLERHRREYETNREEDKTDTLREETLTKRMKHKENKTRIPQIKHQGQPKETQRHARSQQTTTNNNRKPPRNAENIQRKRQYQHKQRTNNYRRQR